MAEGLLRHHLAARGVPDVSVSSAGFLSEGSRATPDAVRVLAARDIDIHEHQSRLVTPELLAASDLVVAMAREHLRQASVLDPGAFTRMFTLKELARRGVEVGAREPDESIPQWLDRVGADRTRVQHLGDSPLDDIADPIGRPLRVYRRTANELDGLIGAVVGLLWPPPPEADGTVDGEAGGGPA
jgi:protein-tyrosine phosphatase